MKFEKRKGKQSKQIVWEPHLMISMRDLLTTLYFKFNY